MSNETITEENKRLKEVANNFLEGRINLLTSFNLMPLATTFPRGLALFSETMAEAQIKSNDKIFSEYIEPDLEKANEIMIENGWWFILSLDSSFYVKLPEIDPKLISDNLTPWIIDYYNDNDFQELEEVIEKWELGPFKANEMVFKDVLWAHKKSKYSLTVPVLTMLVENVLRSYFDSISSVSVHAYKNALKKEYKDAVKDEDNGGLLKFVQLQNIKFLEEAMNKFYKSFKETKLRDLDDIHRHPLLHGQYSNYASQYLSTKLFLFLDMLHWIMKDLERYKNS